MWPMQEYVWRQKGTISEYIVTRWIYELYWVREYSGVQSEPEVVEEVPQIGGEGERIQLRVGR